MRHILSSCLMRILHMRYTRMKKDAVWTDSVDQATNSCIAGVKQHRAALVPIPSRTRPRIEGHFRHISLPPSDASRHGRGWLSQGKTYAQQSDYYIFVPFSCQYSQSTKALTNTRQGNVLVVSNACCNAACHSFENSSTHTDANLRKR